MANYGWQPPASSTGSQWIPDHVYSQPSTMQDWVRAFPRPRHSRVMKPRSAGNSPSAATRRRTTVGQTAMHGLPNQYQSSLEAALLASASRNPRPISWHPSTMRTRGLSNPQAPDFTMDNYGPMGTLPDQAYTPLPAYSGDHLMSYPLSAGPTFSPNGYFPMYSNMSEPMPMPQQTPSMSIPSSQVEPMAWDVSAADFSAMTETASDAWSLDMLSMANIPPAETTCPSYASVPSPGEFSGPSTPEFLPIQQFDDDSSAPRNVKDGKPEEELVGMGLYNQPDLSLGQVPQETLGKGLKLEETFSPSAEEKDDGSPDAGDETSELEASPVQTGPADPAPMMQPNVTVPKQPSKQALNLLHKSFFFDNDDFDQQPMTASQPFASLNQPCMSYGYGWI